MPDDHIPVPPPPAEEPPRHHEPRSHSGDSRQSAWRRALAAGSKQMVAWSLVFGILGGALGSYVFIRYFAGSVPVAKQQVIVQENSAVVDAAKKVSPSVVSITSKTVTRGFFGNLQQSEGAGTGMIVTSDGLILTNRHVVDDANANYTVVMNDGKTYPANVVSRDTANDIAFVRISANNLPTVELGDSGSVQVGQHVIAVGNALGQFQNTVTEGVISGVSRGVTAGDGGGSLGSRTEQLQNLFQTDAAINPGNSGGPLVNLLGQVIGINTAVAGQGAQNIGFAIPVNEAKPLIASVREKGRIVRPYMGVRYVAIDKQAATANNLPIDHGAWVQASSDQNPGVVPDSPAAKAGIKEGDIITKVGGDTVDATHSLQSLINKHKPGEKVQVTVMRDGKEQTFEVTLGESPAGQ